MEIQRAKRLEELSKENEKLYQDLLTKGNSRRSRYTQDITTDGGYSQNGNIGQHGLFKDQNSHSISALHKYDDEEEPNNTIGELLSPFAINPDDF